MADLSDFFPSTGGLPGWMVRDPTFLPLSDAMVGLQLYAAAAGANPNVLAFWDAIASIGAIRTTAAANTYGQIVNISGRGILFHVIPPAIANTSDTVAFKITIDGVPHEIIRAGPWQSNSVGGRPIIGAVEKRQDLYTATSSAFYDFENRLASTDRFSGPSTMVTIPPHRIMNEGLPCVYFETSLKVETKILNVSGAGTYAQYSGATYTLIG